MIQFSVRGIPAPQGSKTLNRYGALYESSKKVAPWRLAIWDAAREHGYAGLDLDCPLSIQVRFDLPRPKSHFTAKGLKESAPPYPHGTPDLDKLLRSTLDGLTQAKVIHDDSRIVTIRAEKSYVVDALLGPGAVIVIRNVQ